MALTEDELKAKKFGLPKVKKFPMPDAAHVRSAIKFFNYAKPSQERELANAILARMDEYGIDPDDINVGDDNRFKKYLEQSHLMHHGIKGMKWGVRRFQNEDGTRTSAGKKRAKVANKKAAKKKKRKLTFEQKVALAELIGATAATAGGLYYINKSEKRQREKYEEQRKKQDEYWKAWHEQRQKERDAAWNRSRQQHRKSSTDNADNSYRTRTKQSTSETKSKDREAKYKNSGEKIDAKEATVKAKEMRDKVAAAQRDGTLTPEMINDLQEAMARAKVARAQMAHSLGFICYINYDDPNYLAHHGIKGMKWGVRRYETAGGHLTSEGKKRYAKYYKAVSNKVSNAATNAKKKAGDSAAKAKKAAANVAKGAAIVGGLAAAGYLGKIGMEEAASFRNNSLAKKAAESLMSDHFTDLDSESRAVVKDRLTAINREKLRNQDRAKSYNRKKLLSDAAKAYNPKSGSKEARDDLREKVRRGAYSSKNRTGIDEVVNKKNINMYETGLRNAAQATVHPDAFNARVRSERQKAEAEHQEYLKRKRAESKARVDDIFQRMADAERKRR